MKKLNNFPIVLVKRTSTFYNKAFHSKIFTLFASSESEVYALAKYFKPHYDFCYAFMKDDQGQWFLDIDGIKRIRNRILDDCQDNRSLIKKIYKDWNINWQKYQLNSQRLLNIDLTKLTDQTLYDEFNQFYNNYSMVGSVAYTADSFMSTGETDWLEQELSRELSRLGVKGDLANKISVLTSPVHLSFTLAEELEIIKLAKVICRKFGAKLPKFKVITKRFPLIYGEIENHSNKFFWVKNNYYNVEYIDTREVYLKIRKIVLSNRSKASLKNLYRSKLNELKTFKRRREIVLANIKLSKFHRNLLETARLFAKWKDIRKSGVYIGMYHFDVFLNEISRRFGISKKKLTYLVFPEIRDIFLTSRNLLPEIHQREKRAFFAVTPKGYYIVGGKKSKQYFKFFSLGSPTTNISEIRGVSASPGLASGKVRVIRKTNEMKLFKNGEILVTNQTTPEFVSIMKKAAAIITEQGGITSHAAVVSRELKVPCIIGTKIATEVLHDGDLVEVNANHGVITVLQRK